MNSLKQLFQDGGGNLSSMRAALALVVGGVIFNWCYLTVHTGQQQPLDWQQVSMVVAAFAAKTAQKAFEPTSESAPTPVTTPPKP